MSLDPSKEVESLDELFYNDRLDHEWVDVTDWPPRIDQAALDLIVNPRMSIGVSKKKSSGGIGPPSGGLITSFDFGEATGGYYKEGLVEISDGHADIESVLREYGDDSIGDLAYRLNEFGHKLRNLETGGVNSDITNLPRALEAVVEKEITQSMHGTDVEVSQNLRAPETTTDAMIQIFSDPSARNYAEHLMEHVENRDLLGILDAPEMVTPLWEHQRDAIEKWVKNECTGYVDMATATGKTVLGLAAIAVCFGDLHPVDLREMEIDTDQLPSSEGETKVLIVAGQDLLLEQWRSEFDEHLDIPRDRTVLGSEDTIELDWGKISFTTADDLRTTNPIGNHDLVILDEAHQYSQGSRSGRGWGAVFEELVDKSGSILAMSGSVDSGWLGDDSVQDFIESKLTRCIEYTVPDARSDGVIANFSWEIRYATAAPSQSQETLKESTQQLSAAYDRDDHRFESSRIGGSIPDSVPETFDTVTDIRSFSQSGEGSTARDLSDDFDNFATAAFSRRPVRWQLTPEFDSIAELVTRHAPEEKVVVLVESYSEADALGESIRNRMSGDTVLVPDADADEQNERIDEFRENEYNVIVGPGEVLGTGVDMPEADVAVNLAKGGVNASLIQRIGRVLRNPDGDKEAHFYHVVTLPSDERAYLFGPDGRRFLRRASEFRGLGDRLRELPDYTTLSPDADGFIARLEREGAEAIASSDESAKDVVGDDISAGYLSEALASIGAGSGKREPILKQEWNGETLEQVGSSSSQIESHSKDDDVESTDASGGEEGDGFDVESAVETIEKSTEDSEESPGDSESEEESHSETEEEVLNSDPEDLQGRDMLIGIVELTEQMGELPREEDIERATRFSIEDYEQEFGDLFGAYREAGVLPDDVTQDEVFGPSDEKQSDIEGSEESDRSNEADEVQEDLDSSSSTPQPGEPEKSDLTAEIRRFADSIEEPPRMELVVGHGRYPRKAYEQTFASWDDALEQAGCDTDSLPDWSGRSYTNKEILDVIESLADDYGRSPTTTEVGEEAPFSYGLASVRFGSWATALELAGLDPDDRPSVDADQESQISESGPESETTEQGGRDPDAPTGEESDGRESESTDDEYVAGGDTLFDANNREDTGSSNPKTESKSPSNRSYAEEDGGERESSDDTPESTGTDRGVEPVSNVRGTPDDADGDTERGKSAKSDESSTVENGDSSKAEEPVDRSNRLSKLIETVLSKILRR
jgi:superfamily II DNA or RNA helicase